MRRIGVVVNPIAGMGGRVGLKGTDGKVEEARERGARPRAPDRATEALRALAERAPEAEILTYGGEMGEESAREAGFDPVVVGEPTRTETTAEDTREAVRRFVSEDVDLILFVGGDGTAVDMAETLDEIEAKAPILGVPAGVKVYSAVFAVTPEAAGRVAADFDRTETREVNDIDEDAYREGEVRAELRALAEVPVAEDLQSSKQVGGGTVESLAVGVAEDARGDTDATYVLGPGGTVGAIKSELGFEGSPLGVDVWRGVSGSSAEQSSADRSSGRSPREDDATGGSSDESDGGEVLVRDASADEILSALGERNVIVVSPIGGQGFVFGRGNDQISPEVIRQSEVEVVASKRKLDDVGVLRVDTGDDEVDESLRGWHKVRVGRFERRMMKVV